MDVKMHPREPPGPRSHCRLRRRWEGGVWDPRARCL